MREIKKFKSLLILMLISVMVLSFVGCAKEESKPSEISKPSESEVLNGSITISGSTSVEKVGNKLAEEFMALNPSLEITYEGIGSSGGVKNARDGVTQFGTASRNLKTEEKEWGLTEVVIAYDGVAIITHPDNTINELTIDQVKAIYIGEITNWSEVGGKDEEIVVVSREDGSGTRGAFEEIIDFEDKLTMDAIIADGNGNVQTTIANNPLSIGYVSFTYINETVKPMLIDKVAPTSENVIKGEYSVSRPFLMIYKEDHMTNASKAFVEFITSAEGQDIVEENGAIRIK